MKWFDYVYILMLFYFGSENKLSGIYITLGWIAWQLVDIRSMYRQALNKREVKDDYETMPSDGKVEGYHD